MRNRIYTLINANVYDGTFNMKLQKGVNIEITNNTITRIGLFPTNPKSKTIDLQGKYVVPGLINLHVHLPSSGKLRKKKLGDLTKLVNFITSNALTKQIGLALCKPQLKQTINSGVTTIRTVGGLADFDTVLRDKIAKGKLLGPRVVAANSAIGVAGGHMVGTVTNVVNSIEDIHAQIDRLANEKVDLVKIMITGGVLDGKEGGKPGRLHMSEEFVKACCDYAHEKGLKVAAHVEGIEGMNIAMKNGVDSIEHSASFDENLVDNFKQRKGAIVLTLSPARPFIDIDPEKVGYGEIAKINSQIIYDRMLDSYKLCKKHNITVGLGTDGGSTLSPHYNFYKELILFSSWCNEDNNYALHTATLTNASIMGLDDKIGSIEEGKIADLLIVENDPILNLENLGKPYMIFANGKLIKKPHVKKDKKIDELLRYVNYTNK